MSLMNIPWKIIIAFAIVATFAITAYDILVASEGDQELEQYKVVTSEGKYDEEVMKHLGQKFHDFEYIGSAELGSQR